MSNENITTQATRKPQQAIDLALKIADLTRGYDMDVVTAARVIHRELIDLEENELTSSE